MTITDFVSHLRRTRSVDLSDYSERFLLRRIELRMSEHQCGDLAEYAVLLESEAAELSQLRQSLTVPISGFMRDPFVFHYLSHTVILELIRARIERGDHMLRIWSAGCSAGQEIYTLAILLSDLFEKRPFQLRLFLLGTDIDERSLEKARKGKYASRDLEQVPFGTLQRHFIQTHDDEYSIRPEIRSMVQFGRHDLLEQNGSGPAENLFRGFDLILCRNVLMYFERKSQVRIFHQLHDALLPGGYMVLGDHEHPPGALRAHYHPSHPVTSVFRKRDTPN